MKTLLFVALAACGSAESTKPAETKPAATTPADTKPAHAALGRYLDLMRSIKGASITLHDLGTSMDTELAAAASLSPPDVARRYTRLLEDTKVIATVGPGDPALAKVGTDFPALPADGTTWSPNVVFPIFVHEAVELEMVIDGTTDYAHAKQTYAADL